MKIKITIIIALITIVSSAQTIKKSSVDSGGASTSSGNIQLIYTIGEVNIQESGAGTVQVSEGFISPEIFSTLNIDNPNENTFELSIYPNPADTYINVETVATVETVNLYNMLGEKVLETTSPTAIDISQLAKGTYILQVVTDKKTINKQIIIK